MSEEEATKKPADENKPSPATADPDDTTGNDDDAPAREEEVTSNFEPIVKLEEVEVKSGTEDEDVVFTKRAKLYIYGETLLDKGSGTRSWRERGVGEVSILRSHEHGRLRLLMRQDKTMKIIANHVVDPRTPIVPMAGNDRSYVWPASDFSEGELEDTTFAARFADSDVADEFKAAFEKAQAEMKALLEGADKPGADGGQAAEEAATALAGLSTKEEETNKENE